MQLPVIRQGTCPFVQTKKAAQELLVQENRRAETCLRSASGCSQIVMQESQGRATSVLRAPQSCADGRYSSTHGMLPQVADLRSPDNFCSLPTPFASSVEQVQANARREGHRNAAKEINADQEHWMALSTIYRCCSKKHGACEHVLLRCVTRTFALQRGCGIPAIRIVRKGEG